VENPHHVVYGHLPHFPLSAKGRRQAAALREYFANKPIKKIYCSPLERAQETALAIASTHPGIEIVTVPGLTESHFSKHTQGVKFKHAPFLRPLWWVHMLKRGLLPIDETPEAMAARVKVPLMQLLAEFPGGSGVCVSHGDPIDSFHTVSMGRSNSRIFPLCEKGGFFELEYMGSELVRQRYHSPRELVTGSLDQSRGLPEISANASG
jgi:broad specificity phosphatase PhoE